MTGGGNARFDQFGCGRAFDELGACIGIAGHGQISDSRGGVFGAEDHRAAIIGSLRYHRVQIIGQPGNMVQAENRLAIRGAVWRDRVAGLLDQFDLHFILITQGNIHLYGRRRAIAFTVHRHIAKHRPRANAHRVHPTLNARIEIIDDIAQLDNGTVF